MAKITCADHGVQEIGDEEVYKTAFRAHGKDCEAENVSAGRCPVCDLECPVEE